MESSLTAPTLSKGDIINLNVGGKRFTTSRQTLTWIPDSFFSSLLSGRIPSIKDEKGAIFIDRDPQVFKPILNFLRTRNVDLSNVSLPVLRHEAEFFGIHPLVKRLAVCEEQEKSSCGSILFYAKLNPPVFDQSTESEPLSCGPGMPKPELRRQVIQIVGHANCIAVAYRHCVCVLCARESRGWDLVFTTPTLERVPQRIALNARCTATSLGDKMLAAVLGNEIRIWTCNPTLRVLATFDMKIPVDGLFFIHNQLVAISNTGKVAVWQSVQRNWQLQDLAPISSYDTAGSYLLLGCHDGNIYYIDMEKFPVRMKDNDLLVTQLFEDPFKQPITALSIFMPPNCYAGQTWMEVAYGTKGGGVRVIVRHPENIGQAPQLFQSYNVHTCSVSKVVLGERHLVSVCAENHVRSWTVTRFRGRISTQPGSTPIASFKVLSLEGAHSLFYPVNSIGPFGEHDDEQVFVQRVIPEIDKIYVRLSATGCRVCEIDSVDSSNISTYCVHECEAINRVGMRSRRFIFTGHVNGSVQLWDLTTALELFHKLKETRSTMMEGPTQEELLRLLMNCDLSGASQPGSAYSSRTPSPSPSLMSIMCPGYKPVDACDGSHAGTPISTPLMRHSHSDDPQQRQMRTHSLGFLEPGHGMRRSGIFNASHLLPQVAERPQATVVVESEMPVPNPCPLEENHGQPLSVEQPTAQTYMADDLSFNMPSQLIPKQLTMDSSFDRHEGPVTFYVTVKEPDQSEALPEEDEDPSSPLQVQKVSVESLAERRPVVGGKTKRSSYSPPMPSPSDQNSAHRPISMDSALSSSSCQSYGSADSDGTLTPHTSRPPSSLSNEQ